MTLTLEQKEKYFRNKNKVKRIILEVAKKENLIIFGSRSVNKRLPKHLQVHTEDYDIFTKKNPKKIAQKIEKKLDKKFKGNFFVSEPAAHPGTHKVKSVIGDREVADISKKPKKIETFSRKGVRYARLNFQKKKIKESLADKQSKYRHAKDRETKTRIQIFEKKKPKKRVVRRRKSLNAIQRSRSIGRLPKNAFAMPKLRFPF